MVLAPFSLFLVLVYYSVNCLPINSCYDNDAVAPGACNVFDTLHTPFSQLLVWQKIAT